MLRAVSQFESPKASQYLQQLCKHFAHKVEASHSATEGRAELPGGLLTMQASGTMLQIEIVGEGPREIAKARYILEEHLIRFAHRENLLSLDWRFE